MVWVAQRAAGEADRARQAQIVMEHLRAEARGGQVTLWRTVATRTDDTVNEDGLTPAQAVTEDLQRLAALEPSDASIKVVAPRSRRPSRRRAARDQHVRAEPAGARGLRRSRTSPPGCSRSSAG